MNLKLLFKKYWKEFLGTLLVIFLFVGLSYVIQQNLFAVEEIIDPGITGILIYVGIGIIATVFAPVTSVPLLPIAVELWGWFNAALLSILGWWIGSIIAFLIARLIGITFVERFISLERIKELESLVPTKHIFWGIIFLRIIIPVDTLSYVLGLFSRIKLSVYSFATLIGIIPMALVLAYVGSLTIEYQVIGLIIFILGFSIIGYYVYEYIKKNKNTL